MKIKHHLALCVLAACLPGLALADEYFVSGENVSTASVVTWSPAPQQYYQTQTYRPIVYQPVVVVPVQTGNTVYYVNQPTRYYPFGGHPQARFNQPPTTVIQYNSSGFGFQHHHHHHRR